MRGLLGCRLVSQGDEVGLSASLAILTVNKPPSLGWIANASLQFDSAQFNGHARAELTL